MFSMFGLGEGGGAALGGALGQAGQTASSIGAAAVETVERNAYLEIIDEMPIVGDLWTYVPPRTGPNGLYDNGRWELTDQGRSVLMWAGIGLAAYLLVRR